MTGVVAGIGLTLCDALDTTQTPIEVAERAGSGSLRPGQQVGARAMVVAGRHRLSGAVYPFSMLAGREVQAVLRALQADPTGHDEDRVMMFGQVLIEHWLAQHPRPPTLPDFVHASTSEPMLFTTDHYAVRDWDALRTALAAQPDVQGNRAPAGTG